MHSTSLLRLQTTYAMSYAFFVFKQKQIGELHLTLLALCLLEPNRSFNLNLTICWNLLAHHVLKILN